MNAYIHGYMEGCVQGWMYSCNTYMYVCMAMKFNTFMYACIKNLCISVIYIYIERERYIYVCHLYVNTIC